jgi:hypothetical protein
LNKGIQKGLPTATSVHVDTTTLYVLLHAAVMVYYIDVGIALHLSFLGGQKKTPLMVSEELCFIYLFV